MTKTTRAKTTKAAKPSRAPRTEAERQALDEADRREWARMMGRVYRGLGLKMSSR